MFTISNTFGLTCRARAHYIGNESTWQSVLATARQRQLPILPVGSASNILFADDCLDAVIVQSSDQHIAYQADSDDANAILVSAGAGVIWHQLVLDTLAQGLSGLENLSLIPGTVGAAPIQNIGAYGVEVAESIVAVDTVDVFSGQRRRFTRDECAFGYRDSVFKRQHKDRLLITSVAFRLQKKAPVRTGYESLAQYLDGKDLNSLTARDISAAVIAVRRARLPDPAEIGNAGSFFKNPVVTQTVFERLQNQYPTLPHYPQADGLMKLAAGWLIDQCGLKGLIRGHVGVHAKQALVLINRGGAQGRELIALAREVKQAVHDRFGISLEHEVRILDRTAQDVVL